MPDRVPVHTTPVEETIPDAPRDVQTEIVEGSFDDSVVERMFEIVGEDITREGKEKLARVLKWCKNRGADSPEKVMWEFRSLIRSLGAPSMADKRINQVYRYVTLDGVINEAKGEMIEMEADGVGK